MNPTPRLRFIQRDGPMMGFHKNSDGSETTMHQKIRILQQWWEDQDPELISESNGTKTFKVDGEWRDVPMEAE